LGSDIHAFLHTPFIPKTTGQEVMQDIADVLETAVKGFQLSPEANGSPKEVVSTYVVIFALCFWLFFA
jgi:hypothetical protein